MKIRSQAYTMKSTGTLLSIALAGVILSVSQTNAQVVFDDGKMHLIDDDTFANELIEVRNGTKLKIVEGAVIAATVFPDYDFFNNTSGLEVLEFSAAAIQVFDTSTVIVQGGVFGGEPFDPNPYPFGFLNNWYSGSIAAWDNAKVIVQDGTFGQGAFRSGTLAMFDNARLFISGGTFTNDGGSGGRIELYANSEAKISGGAHGASINPADNSTLNISGGTFGKHNGFLRGRVDVTGSASVTIGGGTFGGTGFLAGNLSVLSADAQVKINGGEFLGSNINVSAGVLRIEGPVFNMPFGPIEPDRTELFAPGSGLWLGLETLEGVLASGDSINITIGKADDEDAVIELVED